MSLDELRALIDRHAPRDADAVPAIDGLLLTRAERPTGPRSGIVDPVLALVAQGAKRLTLGGRIYDYEVGQYLVVSVDLPVSGHCTRATPDRPFLGFGLRIRPARLAALLLESGTGPRAGTGRRRTDDLPALAVGDASADLLDAVVRMVRLLDRPADIPVLAPMVEREILWRLITGEQGALVRQIGLADSRLTQISRAVRFIREHYTEPLRVEDLARLSGMSASPFHRHFRAVTAMTPIQYQKHIRLQEARLRLMSSTDDIADVGYAVGYDSASQFSREYRRQFGRPPGADAARLRNAEVAVLAGP
ncbi:AraC family transcriptional regulator [Streptomyces arenae]|uniref:AraC family transcriptional regulator n=1 Tax=Streptomyces arenae TaxID=29301 RepID=UPI002657B90F|nr:AraC family transcriptional regulator [Streptomyces arenae]MCG7209171.1 AraC family transcriptional regulator [Streptomyces arenae]